MRNHAFAKTYDFWMKKRSGKLIKNSLSKKYNLSYFLWDFGSSLVLFWPHLAFTNHQCFNTNLLIYKY